MLRWVGQAEFHKLLTSHDIDPSVPYCNFGNAMWQHFSEKIEVNYNS